MAMNRLKSIGWSKVPISYQSVNLTGCQKDEIDSSSLTGVEGWGLGAAYTVENCGVSSLENHYN